MIWPHLVSVSSSVKWGQCFPCELVVRIRDNLRQGPAPELEVHRSYPSGAERSHVHGYKWWNRIRWSFMRYERCKQSLRNPPGRDESRMVSWESVPQDEPGRWAGCWQAVRGGAIPQERKAVKEAGLLMLDSRVQPSSARASRPAHIYHFSSLLPGASTVSLHHCWRALDVLLDGWRQAGVTFS